MIFEAKHDDRVNMGICHFANNTVFTISHD